MTEPDQVVAGFTDYAGAQRAVDALADRRFPVEHLAVVGVGLRSYEQITGSSADRQVSSRHPARR